MKLIGLTGGIATGKSTVSKSLRDLGVPVIDADVLAREVLGENSFGLRSVIENFGQAVLKKDGSLDRAKLGAIIFSDQSLRERLERITHPLIQWRSTQEQEYYRIHGAPLIFYDAALIFEKKLTPQFDLVVVVKTSLETQNKRLGFRDKLTAAEINQRISSQIPIDEKAKLANYVIDNEGSIELTRHQVSVLVNKLISGES
jgi:dephospho-CoA kinase